MLNCFPKWFHQFIFHHEQQRRATPTNILTLHHHLNIIIQIDIKQYLIMILTHTFLFTSETESLLFTSQKFFLFFFVKCLFVFLTYFSIELCVPLLLIWRCLCISIQILCWLYWNDLAYGFFYKYLLN